jgi:hypothetical protein
VPKQLFFGDNNIDFNIFQDSEFEYVINVRIKQFFGSQDPKTDEFTGVHHSRQIDRAFAGSGKEARIAACHGWLWQNGSADSVCPKFDRGLRMVSLR